MTYRYTPRSNKNADLGNIFKELEHTKISLLKTKDNLYIWLGSLIRKIENKEIIVKPVDTAHNRILIDTNLSSIVEEQITQFADK